MTPASPTSAMQAPVVVRALCTAFVSLLVLGVLLGHGEATRTALLHAALVAVLVPYYWDAYGPTNFLYYCDLALFFTLAAFWTEKSIFASMPAVGILLPQTFWCVDFLGTLLGFKMTGLTAYMFKEELSLFTRGLSFFHFWLPFLLVWLVWRLGYDRRAFVAWAVLSWVLQLLCYFAMPAPPPPEENKNLPVNINYVYGFSDEAAQTWMAPLAWLGVMMVGMPLLIFLPTHLLLCWLFPPPSGSARVREEAKGAAL